MVRYFVEIVTRNLLVVNVSRVGRNDNKGLGETN
jgi:hypothetical protein